MTPAGLSPGTIDQLRGWEGRERRFAAIDRRASHAAITRFALAVGDDNPVWWSNEPGGFAPPAFLYTGVNFNAWPDFGGLPPVASEPTTTLWTGCRWRWRSRLRRDECFSAHSVIETIVEAGPPDRRRVECEERILYTGDDGRTLAEHFRKITVMATAAVPTSEPDLGTPYEPDELASFGRAYAAERDLRRGSNLRTADEAAPGTPIGPMLKGPLTIGSLVSFATAWGAPQLPTNRILWLWLEANPEAAVLRRDTGARDIRDNMHWDAQAWAAAGFTNGFDFAPLRVSWFAHLMADWAGDGAWLDRLDVELTRRNGLGDITWLSGVVSELRDEGGQNARAVCQLEGRNRQGELNTRATAEILLPRAVER